MAIKRRFFRPLEESGPLAFYCCLLLLVSLVFAANVSAEPLIFPEEIEMLISSSGLAATEFISVPLAGMPAGNLRYLICGQGVSDEVMTRLDAAISTLYPTQGEAVR